MFEEESSVLIIIYLGSPSHSTLKSSYNISEISLVFFCRNIRKTEVVVLYHVFEAEVSAAALYARVYEKLNSSLMIWWGGESFQVLHLVKVLLYIWVSRHGKAMHFLLHIRVYIFIPATSSV